MNRIPEPHADNSFRKPSPLIAVMVEQIQGFSFLEQLANYSCIEPEVNALRDTPFDLLIFDIATLTRYESEVRSIRQNKQSFATPVLLLVSDDDLPLVAPYIGDVADDIIRTPISTIELKARIDMLTRLTHFADDRQSIDGLPISKEPAGVTNALQALIACNERIIQACSEQDILSGVCKSLTREGGYTLAWVGIKRDKKDHVIRPVTISGIAFNRSPSVDGALDTRPMEYTFKTGRRFLEHHLPGREQVEPQHPSEQNAVLVLPLTSSSGRAESCLAVYTTMPGGFQEREVDLLQQMVDYTIYAIEALREKSRRIQSEQEAQRAAYRDPLTGLANRRAAIETLDRHLRSTGPHAPATGLLYLGINGFKLINDALGHDTGDQLLKEVGQRLQTAVRETDLVARQGGDEFIIVALHDDGFNKPAHLRSALGNLAQRVLESIALPVRIKARDYRIEASIGISLCPLHGKDALALLTKADRAMDEAKKLGGNSVQFFSCEQSKRQHQRLELGNHLYQASEDKAFQLAFQPIIDLSTGDITGAEALIRWPQPDGTSISPAEFIPVAEETGLILTIGEWVIEESLNALERFRNLGYPNLRIAVNLAISQLWQTELVSDIVGHLRSLNLPPSALTVELTEGSLMTDVERMEGIVKEFREAGIGVAIDDFGTGFSSLARLKSLPISTLKIDRSFLKGTPNEESAVKMVRAIAHMAESFGIQCVAEGIETDEQWRLLSKLRCQFGQGFHFAKPLPETEFLTFLEKQGRVAQKKS